MTRWDRNGIIRYKKIFNLFKTAPAYSTYNYTYNTAATGDRLTAYNNVPFVYDALGNPINYSNGTGYTFTWAKGRQLTNVTKGSNSFAFTYDAEGRRTSKVSYGNRTVYYVWDGDRLVGEYREYMDLMLFLYDAEGSVIGFKYKEEYANYTDGEFILYLVNHAICDVIPYFLFGNTEEDEEGFLKWVLD